MTANGHVDVDGLTTSDPDVAAWRHYVASRVVDDHTELVSRPRTRSYGPDGRRVGDRRPGPVGVTEGTAGAGARLCAAYRAEALTDVARRRRLVLSHADLMRRLCEPPLGYHIAQQWDGALPQAEWQGRINTCPRRRALVALVADAEHRDRAAAVLSTAATGTAGMS